jgi:hypothetical protein
MLRVDKTKISDGQINSGFAEASSRCRELWPDKVGKDAPSIGSTNTVFQLISMPDPPNDLTPQRF